MTAHFRDCLHFLTLWWQRVSYEKCHVIIQMIVQVWKLKNICQNRTGKNTCLQQHSFSKQAMIKVIIIMLTHLLVLLSLDHFFNWDNLFTKNIPIPLAETEIKCKLPQFKHFLKILISRRTLHHYIQYIKKRSYNPFSIISD